MLSYLGEHLFKQITAGHPIYAEKKFRDSFSFVSYALPLFSANEAPRTADQTNAWFNRWIIVPFPRRFEGAVDDTTLSAKLAGEPEGTSSKRTTRKSTSGLITDGPDGVDS